MVKRVEGVDKIMSTVGRTMQTVGAVQMPTAEVERFADSARKVGTTVGTVERAATSMSSSMRALGTEFSEAQRKLSAIDGFKSANKSLDAASLAFRRGQQDLRKFKEEFERIEKPSASMTGAFTAAQLEANRLAEAFKAEGMAAREARAALAEVGVPVNQLRAEQQRLRTVVEETTAAMKSQDHVAAGSGCTCPARAGRRPCPGSRGSR